MASTARDLLDDALALPPDERRALASALLDSVDEAPDPGWEQAWADELTRRADAADAAGDLGEPADQVLAELRARYRA